jgi:hypothetical protein
MEQDRPDRDRCPGEEQEEVDRDGVVKVDERLDQAENVRARSVEQGPPINEEHHASSRSVPSVVQL